MQTALFNKTSKAFAWVAAVSLALMALVPSASAFENLGTFRYQWVAQSGTISADGKAHEVSANQGDTVAMSLTIRNRSTNPRALVMYGKSALLAEPGMPNAHAVGLGNSHPRDVVHSWIDPSSFVINGNRWTYYDGAPVNPGETMTLAFNLKIAAGAANGTYDLYTELVREWDGWAEQVDAAGRAIGNGDIFWRVKVGGVVTPPVGSGAATVSLAAGTPAAGNIADEAAANFTKITLAPTGGSATITSLYVTRDGLSTDSEVENVKLIRASDNVQVGNTAGGFNANHEAQIFFSPALTITGPTDFFIRAGVDASATNGHTIRLGIADNADVQGPVTVGAPVWGNTMTVVNLAIGTLDITEFGSITDSTPDVGETDVTLNQFNLVAGSVEDVWVEQITVLKSGSAASDDVTNIELVNETAGNNTVGTVATWTDNKAVFNFSPALKIAKGNTVRFKVRADIVDGSGLTVNADLIDGSDVLVTARGDLYGYYLTPTNSGTWAGTGDSAQTINSGALSISKSSTSAATGNIAISDNQTLGTWDFDARGEDMRITALSVDLGGTITEADDVSNARIYDAAGNIVAGPVDASADGAVALDRELDFTQTFVVPVGVHKYTLKVRIDNTASAGETLTSTITAAGDVVAKGVRTNNTITATIAGAALNTQTVKGATLVSTTLTQPAARSIVPNQQDFIFGTASLDASASGENMLITGAQWSIVTSGAADADDLVNMEIWADLTAASSPRGDAYETRVSNTTQPSGTNADGDDVDQSFSFTQTVTIAKGTFTNIAFLADVASTADNTDTFTISLDTDAGDVTATGQETGTSVTTAPTGTAALMTIATSGTLTATVDSTSPLRSIVVGGSQQVKAGVFRFAADNIENIELDIIDFETALTGADDVSKWEVYSNRDGSGNLVGGMGVKLGESASSSATAFTITIPDGTSVVPANGNALITVYANVSTVDGVAVINGDDLQVGIDSAGDNDITYTGKSSGASTDIDAGGADLDAATHEIMKSRLTASVAATSPSGSLIPSALSLVAEFNLTADAAADVTFRSTLDELLSINFDVVAADVAAGTEEVRLVRKSTGTVLDSDTGFTAVAGANAYQADFNFSTAALTIAAGTTEVIQVFVDTDDLEDAGDSIRAYIDDVAADVTYGTEGGDNEVALGDIVARGDIRANVLVKP